MICHIIQNGGYIALILLLFCFNKSISEEYTFAVQEYCAFDKLLHNIEPGSDLILNLNSGSSARINKLFHKSKRKCRKEFRTSDSSAHLEVSIINLSIPESCSDCRCNYFEIWTPYGHSKRFCGQGEEYFHSKTDTLTIDFYPRIQQLFDVTLKFSAKRNFYIITGTSSDASASSMPNIFVETPYFPAKYPPFYKADYLLQCDVKSYVMLLFLDFQVSSQSFIEVVGANGTHPRRYYGHVFRPPVLVSESYSLTLKFESNYQEERPGFRAEFSCIKSKDPLYVPFTDCGGQSPGREGLISIKTLKVFALYDCIWHIPSMLSTKSFLSVFITLKNISHKSSLVFREGYYSKSEIVKEIDCENQNCSSVEDEVKVLASSDLYIRFRGYLDEISAVEMSYNTYHLENCSNTEFRCSDNRCLQPDFRCDGVKQCPDGLDEHTCPASQVSGDRNSSHPSVPTIFISGSSAQNIFIVFLVFGIAGLILIIVAFIFIKNYCRRTTASDQSLSQSIDELFDLPSAPYPVTDDENDDNPPTYEDFMQSTEKFPPILFTRAGQHSDTNPTHCTTSFCTEARVRHHSTDSFKVRSSNSGSDIFLNITGEDSNPSHPSPMPESCNIEINQTITFNPLINNLRRFHSLDSKLCDPAKNDYNFSLSITQPVCLHMSDTLSHTPQCNTLPPNYKPKEFKTKAKEELKRPASLRFNSHFTIPQDRRSTWSFGPHRAFEPEIVTVVKTRCASDPCKGISVHYSLY